ncbi:hypothetical protein BGX38DRAFT_1192513 [Terfezia claveryi]|nr:hypothetical protein BGX38DRAFT_1192513 [Terfezia claveryi]
MQLQFPILSLVLIVAFSISSGAWMFTGFREKNFKGGNIGLGGGTFECKDIPTSFQNAINSFQWKSEPIGQCTLYVYNLTGCAQKPMYIATQPQEDHPNLIKEKLTGIASILAKCSSSEGMWSN